MDTLEPRPYGKGTDDSSINVGAINFCNQIPNHLIKEITQLRIIINVLEKRIDEIERKIYNPND